MTSWIKGQWLKLGFGVGFGAPLRCSRRSLARSIKISTTRETIGAASVLRAALPVTVALFTCTGVALAAPENYNFRSAQELASALNEKLFSIRDNLRGAKKQCPPVNVKVTKTMVGKTYDVFAIEMKFRPQANVLGLFDNWVQVLDLKDSSMAPKERERLKQFYVNKVQNKFECLSDKYNGGIIIKKLSNGTVSASFFKSGGFSEQDLNYLVAGYKSNFDVKSTDSFLYAFNANYIDPSAEDEFGLHNPLDDFFRGFFGDDSGAGGGGGGSDIFGMPLIGGRSFSSSASTSQFRDPMRAGGNDTAPNDADPADALVALGVEVFTRGDKEVALTWDNMAGYSHVKANIKDTIINPLKHPEVYDEITRKTREVYEDNKAKAILFEGPPGTGKTLCARILAHQCDRPLVVLKLDAFVSKWYGESEKKLSQILDACDSLGNAIIFIDEVDAIAQSRDSGSDGGGGGGMHEASRRILSTILQRIEGFHGKGKSLLVCATNRKQDLDSALLSRFDLCIPFDLPDRGTRKDVFRRYAKQFVPVDAASSSSSLSAMWSYGSKRSSALPTEDDAYSRLADASEGFSCRDIKDVCENAERVAASRTVQKLEEAVGKGSPVSSVPLELPTLEDYMYSLETRRSHQHVGKNYV